MTGLSIDLFAQALLQRTFVAVSFPERTIGSLPKVKSGSARFGKRHLPVFNSVACSAEQGEVG